MIRRGAGQGEVWRGSGPVMPRNGAGECREGAAAPLPCEALPSSFSHSFAQQVHMESPLGARNCTRHLRNERETEPDNGLKEATLNMSWCGQDGGGDVKRHRKAQAAGLVGPWISTMKTRGCGLRRAQGQIVP